MSTYVEMEFCELPDTPYKFDVKKFKADDPEQIKLYKDSKIPRRKTKLKMTDINAGHKNYARVVPEGCCFIDFDNSEEAENMKEIILASGVKCLVLETTHGYHFLFRTPEFYEKEMTGATNWFGYGFDTKAHTDKHDAVQIMRACGMDREERMSWDWGAGPVAPESLNIESLDVLPYWLWGKEKDTDLHKGGKTGDRSEESAVEYTLKDTPFTQLMTMKEGGRHNHIVERCSYFGVSNGFYLDEFKSLIQAIHDKFSVKIGTPMSESDLFGDLEKRWEEYKALLSSNGWIFEEAVRKWRKVSKKAEKIDERRAALWLFNQFDFYGKDRNIDGKFDRLFYRTLDGPYEYKTDVTVIRHTLKTHSEQNFKETFFKEVEEQVMQLCAENNKIITRSDVYIIVKNKVLSCITADAYDFEWLGTKPPTDVVLPWNWYSREWVAEHEEDLGKQINWFISQLSRDARGIPQKEVQDWLWVIAGASMIPANQLQKIVILAGGGQNGKSLYTSLIRLCLGDGMWNESKIFDSDPHDNKFWGEDLDKGILCVIDDLNRIYNREAFSYIKGAVTGTDTVMINEKFKPKKKLEVLPQIIACTNFEFELYDKSEGMKRRVKILPTEYHVPDSIKDVNLQHKLVLNVTTNEEVAEYKMKESAFGDKGTLVMNMHTRESGVLESLQNGTLAWFANKAHYMYIDYILRTLKLSDSEGMKEKLEGVFSGGFDAEILEFLEWYITERKVDIWTKELYGEYIEWHNEMSTGEKSMAEKAFAMRLGRAVGVMNEKGYKVEMRKTRNEKGMTLNKLFISDVSEANEASEASTTNANDSEKGGDK